MRTSSIIDRMSNDQLDIAVRETSGIQCVPEVGGGGCRGGNCDDHHIDLVLSFDTREGLPLAGRKLIDHSVTRGTRVTRSGIMFGADPEEVDLDSDREKAFTLIDQIDFDLALRRLLDTALTAA